jgi:hypothetical protein
MESVTSSRPERSGFSLHRTGMMVMLHGLRGRRPPITFGSSLCRELSPAPLEAGAGKGNSPASLRALRCARMAQDGCER